MLQSKPGLRLNPFLQVKLVILILPSRLNMHSDELRKPSLEPKLNLENK